MFGWDHLLALPGLMVWRSRTCSTRLCFWSRWREKPLLDADKSVRDEEGKKKRGRPLNGPLSWDSLFRKCLVTVAEQEVLTYLNIVNKVGNRIRFLMVTGSLFLQHCKLCPLILLTQPWLGQHRRKCSFCSISLVFPAQIVALFLLNNSPSWKRCDYGYSRNGIWVFVNVHQHPIYARSGRRA
jgi:hypothetical protein